ncbi:ribosome recycling factor [Patescibacteria group bacterium]|nr:ribosome recycling factor [Patescibacteria group bacterium]
MDFIKNNQEKFTKVVDFLKKDVQSLRTNRVSTELVAPILVEAYGVKTRLDQLASLSIPEPRLILIQPWDKSIFKNIEQALIKAEIGVMPVISDGFIRLKMPSLNEESRKHLVKILHEKLENSRRNLRGIRDEVKEEIVNAEKNKEISEDDKYRFFDELDQTTREEQEKIKEIGEKKEKEIMEI